MSVSLPDGLRGRLMALGLLALVAALAWVAVAEPLLGWHAELSEAVAGRLALARRMSAIVDGLPDLRRQAQAGNDGASSVGLLEGGTDALAGAALQARLRSLAAQNAFALASVETLPAEILAGAAGFRRIGVRISATAGWPVLVSLLRELDGASPRLLVDDLQLQSVLSLAGGPRTLSMTATVLGFRTAAAP